MSRVRTRRGHQWHLSTKPLLDADRAVLDEIARYLGAPITELPQAVPGSTVTHWQWPETTAEA